MIKKNFLICLAGLPASGKTTFAISLKEYFQKELRDLEIHIIDPDIIRNSLTSGGFDPTKEQLVRKKNLEEVKTALSNGFVVISDDLNYYSSMRHDLKEICENLNLLMFIIHMSTPIETCLKWNEVRGKSIPNEVIIDINKKFDNFDRYMWDQPILTIDMSINQDLNNISNMILKKITHKFEISDKIEVKKSGVDISEITYFQKLDKITRAIVGEVLKDINLRCKSKEISNFRKKYIKQHSKIHTDLSIIPDQFRKSIEELIRK